VTFCTNVAKLKTRPVLVHYARTTAVLRLLLYTLNYTGNSYRHAYCVLNYSRAGGGDRPPTFDGRLLSLGKPPGGLRWGRPPPPHASSIKCSC
jgi:hypothetical protein